MCQIGCADHSPKRWRKPKKRENKITFNNQNNNDDDDDDVVMII